MFYLKKVQIAVDFIEGRLDQDIQLVDVAKAAGMSQWHFQRVFKALSKETLKTYIRSRRLANALEKLRVTDERIIEISIAAGYDSQAAFTRAFKKTFGLTPNAYRKIGESSLFLKKLELSADYLRHINKNLSLEPEIVTQEAMSLVGKRTTFFGSDSEKNNIADKLPSLWEAFLPHLDEVKSRIGIACYGVIRQLPGDGEELEYFAVTQVKDLKNIPNEMVGIGVEASEYARFSHRGDPRMLDDTVSYIYSTWLMSTSLRHTYGPDLETYAQDYDPTSPESLIYYSIPIR